MSSPIEDYALIGDGQTAALVNKTGAIDWLCWPQFDSDACFAALLGTHENGRWLIAPKTPGKVVRRYKGDTLILETDIESPGGTIRITDFMPIRESLFSSVVRHVEALSGTVECHMDLRMRFDYGALAPWCEPRGKGLSAKVGQHQVVLDSPVDITIAEGGAVAAFTMKEGETLDFVLSYSQSTDPTPASIDARKALGETQTFWEAWVGHFDVSKTKWPAVVKRSLITLRAMVHFQTGGLVAAPTTSLPEEPGGTMNWDYRYCWLRDSTFTLGALVNAGYCDEAKAWRDWLLRAVAGSPEQMRIMYRVDGSRHLGEWTVAALDGYRGSVPVHIGNAASTQHQIDVYGEVLDCLSLARKAGIEITAHHKEVEKRIVDELVKVWDTKGSGIWESRGDLKQYTYSKAMAWVGLDRALGDGGAYHDESAERRDELEALRDTIHEEVCRDGFNVGLNTFTQTYGTQTIDASTLLMAIVGFLPANDPRMAATIDTVKEVLSEGGLIRRLKRHADGGNEGAFLACSCWMADCLEMQGKHDEAVAQFERLLSVANDVGLFSEEYNVPAKHLAGNFPQALTHLAVINTALGLSGPVLTRGGA